MDIDFQFHLNKIHLTPEIINLFYINRHLLSPTHVWTDQWERIGLTYTPTHTAPVQCIYRNVYFCQVDHRQRGNGQAILSIIHEWQLSRSLLYVFVQRIHNIDETVAMTTFIITLKLYKAVMVREFSDCLVLILGNFVFILLDNCKSSSVPHLQFRSINKLI